ncbi:fungal specific transcription factor domain protein [Drechmeria coniospora]|uniref:Fungal specific transcription factor domain protein n=1 Tax=Drechmeria coniospora TaxID=98403 RepID=A0A151GNV5_DRECN|nr:fungal specific transcription factor domain protein [Drechmeria coniospora]KYK58789.1 fungal specific transcription factor domain protein [Drechmeria coniospora]
MLCHRVRVDVANFLGSVINAVCASERKIDQIESRLGNIESLLKNIASPTAPSILVDHRGGAPVNTPGTGSSVLTAASTADYESSEEESAFGGDTGLTAHTTFASEFLEKAVRRTSLREVNPKMEAALLNLSQLVEMQKRRSISHGPRFPLQKPVPPGGICKLPMPPMAAVVNLLKHAKSAPPTLFTIMCSLVGLSDFSSLCRLVYFATEDFSDATFTIVNAMLYNLFMEQHSLATEPLVRDEYHSYMQMCRANLETSLANTPLFLSAKVENVQALLLGGLYAVDVSRPSVAWHLSCMAAQLCQTAGYHRSATLMYDSPATAKLKRILFWHVYTLDKGLGLRLGRAPVIHECDIDIPRVFEFDGFGEFESSSIPTLWVKISYLQSRIYEQLYSPAALASPQEELIERAKALARDCRKLEVEAEQCREQVYNYLRAVNSSDVVDIFLRGDEVQFQVTLTLVYRVIPAPEGSASRFCDECLEVARKAMTVHQQCVQLANLGSYFRSIYVHWNLLLTPFAPFFVLFCYIIETSSLDDLRILQEFVASLDEVRDSSETIEKLYRLCRVMCDVAGLYVEAKSQQQEDQTMVPIGDEFEMYLSQLGFMSTEDQAMSHAQNNGGPPPVNGRVAQIADWFSGNRNMMGLLEEDLSQIESYRWMQQSSSI